MRKHRITEEEKVAQKIVNLLSDIRIDLDLVGMYFARAFSYGALLRLETLTDSALEEREKQNGRTERNFDY